MSLSTFDILKIAKNKNLPLDGVFSKDKINSNSKNIIINLEDFNDGNGTHWVLCIKNKLNPSIYFDSFGLPPPKNVIDFVNRRLVYNTEQIQDNKSNMCGYWCLYVLNELNKGRDYNSILNDFTEDTLKNENLLIDYLKKNKILL